MFSFDSLVDNLNKISAYTEDDFKEDLRSMIDKYNNLKEINIDNIRNEIYNYNLSIPPENSVEDFSEVYASYTRYIDYQNRLTMLHDEVKQHSEFLKYIISSAKDLGCQFLEGTKTSKESTISAMIAPLIKHYSDIDVLLGFIHNTSKTIDFGSQQLNRLIKEKETILKFNNPSYNMGSSAIYNNTKNVDVKTKTKLTH